MRTLHLWNRHDIAQLSRGVSFDFKIGDEIHTHRAEHPYKRAGLDHEPKATIIRRKHSDAFKRRVAARVRKGEPVAKLAKDLTLAPSLIRTWAKREKA